MSITEQNGHEEPDSPSKVEPTAIDDIKESEDVHRKLTAKHVLDTEVNDSTEPLNQLTTLEQPQKRQKKNKDQRGQNKGRKFNNSKDLTRLCPDIALSKECTTEGCQLEHDVTKYLASKPADIGPTCPVYERKGHCDAGYRCRWYNSHPESSQGSSTELQNVLSREVIGKLRKKSYVFSRSDRYISYLDELLRCEGQDGASEPDVPFRAVEKTRLDWSGAKILAPLTTTGNLPFRQICRDFGADVTYSEMALSSSLISGAAGECALTRSHISERDTRSGRKGLYGIQLAGPKPPVNIKAAELLTNELSDLDFIDLNCGCPIDLVFKTGAGSALLDNQGKLIKILKGMSLIAGPTPITCKIRMGVSDKKPTAGKLLAKLNAEACVSMVTLHGRSRQQRYARSADWTYIAECATNVRAYHARCGDTDLRSTHGEYGYDTRMAFIGNGDVYSYTDWNAHMTSGVDGCMIARGALIKPWIFEEITAQQHIDKSSSERLNMIGEYCRHGLNYWGSDAMGVDKTRRFMLEFMSFHHRYVPVGLLERPLAMNERSPQWTGRNEMETLLGSEDFRDWIKISEMFLGKAADSFNFIPKHKTNMVEGEG